MIKRTMYFYDKKQANTISKLNDALHKQRGVKVGDTTYKTSDDANFNNILKTVIIDNIERDASRLKNQLKNFDKALSIIKRSDDIIYIKKALLDLSNGVYMNEALRNEYMSLVNRLEELNNYNKKLKNK